MADFALPNDEWFPAKLSQRADIFEIPLRITFDFVCPEIDIRLR